jgi:TonB family protein
VHLTEENLDPGLPTNVRAAIPLPGVQEIEVTPFIKSFAVRMSVFGRVHAFCAALPVAAQESVATNAAVARAVKKVAPGFPAAARQLHLTGTSEVQVTVSEAGDVIEAKILKGNAIFFASSMAAGRQWKFTPLSREGATHKFTTVLIFNFAK